MPIRRTLHMDASVLDTIKPGSRYENGTNNSVSRIFFDKFTVTKLSHMSDLCVVSELMCDQQMFSL